MLIIYCLSTREIRARESPNTAGGGVLIRIFSCVVVTMKIILLFNYRFVNLAILEAMPL